MKVILTADKIQTPGSFRTKSCSGSGVARMQAGDLVVLVEDVEGVEAGRVGCVMSVRDNMVTVGCRSRGRLQLVMARTWQLLPERVFRRLWDAIR